VDIARNLFPLGKLYPKLLKLKVFKLELLIALKIKKFVKKLVLRDIPL
jgi:hypothetical protein